MILMLGSLLLTGKGAHTESRPKTFEDSCIEGLFIQFNLISFFSNTGKQLMAKCRKLYQENEELGKMISSGRLAKLETDLALQKSLTEEIRKAQAGNLSLT